MSNISSKCIKHAGNILTISEQRNLQFPQFPEVFLCAVQGLLFVRNGIIELSDRWLFMMLHAICLNVVHNKTNWGFSLLDTNVK